MNLRTIFDHVVTNFKCRFTYRWDFVFAIFIKAAEAAIGLLILDFQLQKVGLIGNFTRPQMILVFGISELSFALWHCFFINSLSIGAYIQEGTIDRFLLRPLNPILQILLDGFDEDGWGNLIVAIATIAAATSMGVGPVSPLDVAILIFFAFCGAFVFFSISLLLSATGFWARAQTNLGLLTMDLRFFARFPLNIYPSWLKIVLSTIVPLAICGYWPTLFFTHRRWEILPATLVTTILFVFVSVRLFGIVMRRSYESAGT